MKKILNASIICFGLLLSIAYSHGFAQEKKTAFPVAGSALDKSAQSYRIGPGDILEIKTWKEPDFTTEEILVRIDGKITFPVLDDVQASGLTPMELKGKIQTKLNDYIESPVVTVSVKNPVSQKIYILGEVQNTGEYSLSKNLTVLQAFALAGGFTEWASKKEILLLRNEGGKERMFRISYKKIIKGEVDQNLKLKANDTIIVP